MKLDKKQRTLESSWLNGFFRERKSLALDLTPRMQGCTTRIIIICFRFRNSGIPIKLHLPRWHPEWGGGVSNFSMENVWKKQALLWKAFFPGWSKTWQGPFVDHRFYHWKSWVGFLPRILQWLMCQQANQLSLVVYPHYLQGFIHPRWCRSSSINCIIVLSMNFRTNLFGFFLNPQP